MYSKEYVRRGLADDLLAFTQRKVRTMSQYDPDEMVSTPEYQQQLGFFRQLLHQTQLAWRLFLDNRVSMGLKLLPPLLALYIVSPIDLMPGLVLGPFGLLDDLGALGALIWTTRLMIDMAPPGVVQEHLRRLAAQAGLGTPAEDDDLIEGEIIIDDA